MRGDLCAVHQRHADPQEGVVLRQQTLRNIVRQHQRAAQRLQDLYAILFLRQITYRGIGGLIEPQAVTADLRYNGEVQLVHEPAKSRDHGRVAKDRDLRLVGFEHHTVHTILHGFRSTFFQRCAQNGACLASELPPDLLQPGERSGIAVGRARQEGRAAFLV